ncbi:MAG: hypothetical protein Tsb0013_02410 [Phycisphaerales bacterium]
MNTPRRIWAYLAVCAIALLAPGAGAQTLDDILSSLAQPRASAPTVAPDERARGLLDEARNAALLGDTQRAWVIVREARAEMGDRADRCPELFRISADIALREGDAWRGAVLLRRVLTLEPGDTASRERLTGAILGGAGAEARDAWVLARALRSTTLEPNERATALRLLADVLEDLGRPEDASVVREEGGRIARTLDTPEFVGVELDREQRQTIALSLGEAVQGVLRDPLAQRSLVTEMLRAARDIEGVIDEAEEREQTPELIALTAQLLCEQGEARRGDALLRSALDDHPSHPALLAARARTLHNMGDYELLRELARSLDQDTPESLELGATLLRAGGAASEALSRARRALDGTDPSDADRLVRRAMLCAGCSLDDDDPSSASVVLLEAHRSVPTAGAPLRLLASLHAPDGPEPSEELHAMARARLLALDEESHDAAVVRATDALKRGYADIAEGVLLGLASDRPEDPLPARLLVGLWMETDRAGRAEAWLDAQLEQRPALTHLRLLLSGVYIERNRVRRALAILEAWHDDNPGDIPISLELERVYRDHARAPEQAERLALRRLKRLPDSLDALKERAAILARLGNPDDLGVELDRLLPLAQNSGEDLGPWSIELFRALFRDTVRRRAGQIDVTPIVVRLHAGIPSTPFDADELAIRALASGSRDVNSVIDAVRRGMTRHPERAHELAMIGASELITDALAVARMVQAEERAAGLEQQVLRQRYHASLDLAKRAVVGTLAEARPAFDTPEGRASAATLGRALEFTERVGNIISDPGEHGRDLADTLLALQDPTPALVAKLDPERADELLLDDEARSRIPVEAIAREAHSMSYAFPGDTDRERSDALTELGLRLEPTSPTINNDYGYRLAERNERLDEAERMTLLAVRSSPTNHSFLDSLGWVRYKMGKLEDTRTERGAVSLLDEAYRLAASAADNGSTQALYSAPVLGDHLGDALWAAGRTDEAVRAWEMALPRADRVLAALGLEPGDPRDEVAEAMRVYLDTRAAVEAKLRAAKANEAPPVAPPHGPGYTPPDPDPDDAPGDDADAMP